MKCIVCDRTPAIPETGLCGPCTFGEADTAGEVFIAAPVGSKSDAFVVGYSTCEEMFFGPGVPNDFDPTTVVNPFREGTDQHRGFEEAFYDFTQK